jgi:hypothetical protein
MSVTPCAAANAVSSARVLTCIPAGWMRCLALVQERPDLALGLGDGAGDDAEQFGGDALRHAEACRQDGGQDRLGQGERGRVPAGGLAAGGAATGDAQPGFAVGLVRDDQRIGQLGQARAQVRVNTMYAWSCHCGAVLVSFVSSQAPNPSECLAGPGSAKPIAQATP